MVKKETIAEGRTVEAAVSAGAAELGSTPERVTYEIIETPKRGFLGFGETPAKVRVTYQIGPEDIALEFVRNIIDDMGIAAEAEISRSLSGSGDRQINIFGSDAGMLIGHHGETLDSLQFLTNLAVNKDDDDEDSDGYTRIVVDIENYRAKREDTLRTLARSMAARVKKYRKNITLEPMNPYERRIIHSEIQTIPGVSTISVGQDASRRVVIYYEESGKSSAQLAQQAAAEAQRSGDGLGE
ncbi:MAG: protein jag, partial [Clostridia bacterium]|nr:protein jag [Clostridia bacterium]